MIFCINIDTNSYIILLFSPFLFFLFLSFIYREKLKAKFASQGAHVKGQERRVKVSTLKPTVVDDKKLTATLKKIGVSAIANVEEG